MTEIPAKGVKGYLLYSPWLDQHIFRVYESEDKKIFTDYKLIAQEIPIEITGSMVSLYKDENKEETDHIGWASSVLTKAKEHKNE